MLTLTEDRIEKRYHVKVIMIQKSCRLIAIIPTHLQAIDFHEDEAAFKALVRAAVALNASGKRK